MVEQCLRDRAEAAPFPQGILPRFLLGIPALAGAPDSKLSTIPEHPVAAAPETIGVLNTFSLNGYLSHA